MTPDFREPWSIAIAARKLRNRADAPRMVDTAAADAGRLLEAFDRADRSKYVTARDCAVKILSACTIACQQHSVPPPDGMVYLAREIQGLHRKSAGPQGHINVSKRARVLELHRMKWSEREIVKETGIPKTTVHRYIKENGRGP